MTEQLFKTALNPNQSITQVTRALCAGFFSFTHIYTEMKYLMISFLVAQIKLLYPTNILQKSLKTSRHKYGKYLNENKVLFGKRS